MIPRLNNSAKHCTTLNRVALFTVDTSWCPSANIVDQKCNMHPTLIRGNQQFLTKSFCEVKGVRQQTKIQHGIRCLIVVLPNYSLSSFYRLETKSTNIGSSWRFPTRTSRADSFATVPVPVTYRKNPLDQSSTQYMFSQYSWSFVGYRVYLLSREALRWPLWRMSTSICHWKYQGSSSPPRHPSSHVHVDVPTDHM